MSACLIWNSANPTNWTRWKRFESADEKSHVFSRKNVSTIPDKQPINHRVHVYTKPSAENVSIACNSKWTNNDDVKPAKMIWLIKKRTFLLQRHHSQKNPDLYRQKGGYE